MTEGERPDGVRPDGPTRARLAGVDAARGLALLGMMAVHVLPAAESGRVTWPHLAAAGRSSALFAVLAGVGLALASGGPVPPAGPVAARRRRAVTGRAAVIAVVGLALGGLPTAAAVILPYYAVLFLVALPVLGWPARRLALLAVTAALVAPAVSHLLRPLVTPGPGPNLSWWNLHSEPSALMLLLTGYYPVLTWTAYLFAGMAVGRLRLDSPRVATGLAAGGAALAAAAWTASSALLAAGGRAAVAVTPDGGSVGGLSLDERLRSGFYGTAPTSSWWWLVVATPHSGTTPDLVHTTGTALAVLGICLLLLRHPPRASLPLVAAGSLPLTLYTLHVTALAVPVAGLPAEALLGLHVTIALLLATLWTLRGGRGPLEHLAWLTARALAGPGGGHPATGPGAPPRRLGCRDDEPRDQAPPA